MKKIIIIGGGFAGANAAKILEKRFDVTLIDTKDYFEFTPGVLRTIVEPEHLLKLQVRHEQYLKRAKFVLATVSAVGKTEIIANRIKYPYDYLIISSGSKYTLPIKEEGAILATRGEHLLDAHTKLFNAKNIVIVGGGLVGVELAAEIVTHYKDKKVTIVHSGETLIERNKNKSQKYAEKFLRKHGVDILYNERVVSGNNGVLTTEKGVKLRPNMTFLCTGIKPNTSFMKKPSSALNDENQIKVNEFMQVSGYQNIFAPGDLNDVQVEKTAQNSEQQAITAAKNIIRIENNQPLIPYKPTKTPIIISLGKHKGILEWNGFALYGILPALLKAMVENKEMRKIKN